MILSEFVNVKLGGGNREHFEKLGYEFINGKIITVPIMHLTKKSHAKIHVKCDICENEKDIRYTSYMDNFNNKDFYCCSIKCSRVKFKITCNEKYGADNVFQNEEIKSKSKKTIKEKYGVEFSQQSKEIRKKGEETKERKYKNKNYNNPQKTKETCLLKYNMPCALNLVSKENKINGLKMYFENNPEKIENLKIWMASDEFKMKSKMSIKEKYNVEHIMHVDYIVNKNHFSGKLLRQYNKDIYYRGTYERDFLDKYYKIIKMNNPKSIIYFLDNIEKRYFPDFFIPELNLMIEIKSEYTFNIDLKKNIAKHIYSKRLGYKHLFIIDKNYKNFERLLKLQMFT